jgi:hypothetical protein
MTTIEELALFHRFAENQLDDSGTDCSLQDLLDQWRASREREEANAAIRRGLANIDAGQSQPWDEFMDEFRQQHGFSADE